MNVKDRTRSHWEDASSNDYPKFSGSAEAEVCIIGGGVSGLSIAYELAKRGKKVSVVEAFRFGSGQTGRSTGHLSSQLERSFSELLRIHDPETVRIFLEAHRSAIDAIETLILQEDIHCDFRRIDGFLFTGAGDGTEFLKEERAAAREAGISLEPVLRTPLLRQKTPGLKFAGEARYHPLKFIWGLLRSLEGLGVALYENSRVTGIEKLSTGPSRVTLEDGATLTAPFIVVATDAPINSRFSIPTKQFPYRTYAVTLELSREVEDVLLWDTEEPYHYVRTDGRTLIVGGEDHRVGVDPESDPFDALEAWARGQFEHLGAVLERWSGQVFEPADGIGFIGRAPGAHENVFVATGYSGIGLTSAMIAAQIIPNLIEDRFHPFAEVFDPRRSQVRNLPELVRETISGAIHYADWFTGAEVQSLADIPEDSGCLMRQGLTKTCVYHDQGDSFERRSAVCTHLGGIVHWNDIEKTWDCPAHGSRFNTQGTPIEGPALGELREP